MTEKPDISVHRPKTAAEAREARLKAALKANMTKRKAQAKARKAEDDPA